MPGADAGGHCRGRRLISSDGVGKNAAAVLAALAAADVDVGSCGAGAGVSCHGGRLISSTWVASVLLLSLLLSPSPMLTLGAEELMLISAVAEG